MVGVRCGGDVVCCAVMLGACLWVHLCSTFSFMCFFYILLSFMQYNLRFSSWCCSCPTARLIRFAFAGCFAIRRSVRAVSPDYKFNLLLLSAMQPSIAQEWKGVASSQAAASAIHRFLRSGNEGGNCTSVVRSMNAASEATILRRRQL